MVTSTHEGMHRIFQERPEILAPVFKVLEVPLSAKATVDAVTTDVTETRPLERRVDTVLRIGQSDGEDFLLAIEAQSDKKEAKAASWAYYIAYLQAKYRLPVLLLVVCQDRATAKWAVGPFECGTSEWTALRTYPLVAGPDNLPVITDTRTVAKKLALAVLSAVAHARTPECGAILESIGNVLQELQETDPETVGYFAEFLEINLGNTPAGMQWKEIMSFVSYFPGRGTVRETAYLEGRAEGEAEGRAQGEAAGEAKGILFVLEVRGIPVPDSVRERITACTDLDRMDAWLERSRTVERAEDLFAEDPETQGTGPEAA
ncbi:hypothetical protein SAMN05216489_06324 [Streptomyces sp. 3213]|uniref:hypothetical protein n=1 Tax=Streptomyces sp. 3213.3 TaxID=1855348 RepID=UPI00089AC71E|nr:hypothetical protein [Streptomyces sp. 3213.3]SEE35830.1 hypothetical protein SAMN05216489_06324 [Streptomyces sp. 3213] [Streptomyces sp. 3213.3]